MPNQEDGWMGKVLIGLILTVFSAVSSVAIATGRDTNQKLDDLGDAVRLLGLNLRVLEERVARLPPADVLLRITLLEKRMDNVELKHDEERNGARQ